MLYVRSKGLNLKIEIVNIYHLGENIQIFMGKKVELFFQRLNKKSKNLIFQYND